jgi:hypothetical protein
MKLVGVCLLFLAVAGCNSLAKYSIEQRRTPAGTFLAIGQFQPEKEHGCKTLKEEKQPWGMAGKMDPMGKRKELIEKSLPTADKLKANYVFVDLPSETSVMGVNVNAFADAKVHYYACQKVPQKS